MGGGRDVYEAPMPQAYGFDESLVSFEGLGERILPPGGLSGQSERLGKGPAWHVAKHMQTPIYVDRSIDFIRRNRDKSFYLHLWLNDVHDRHVPSEEQAARYARLSNDPYLRDYYAVLDAMDEQIGRLVGAIDAMGLAENTLIVVTSDNGPTAWPRYYQEGYDAPGSTGGFRGRKWSLYEGGIRMPLIARWKGKIPAGQVDETTILGAVDLFPTFCGIAGVAPPRTGFDGEDMSAALLGRSQDRTKPLYWEYGRDETYLKPGKEDDQSPNLAIRDGRWKLLVNADGTRRELYDFDASTKERENVADTHPQVAERLSRMLLEWRRGLPML
jgi:arylsulfatase A-like enzyme